MLAIPMRLTSPGEAQVHSKREDIFRIADIIVQVLCHGSNDRTGNEDLPLLRRDQVLIGFLRPLGSIETIARIADRKCHVVRYRVDAAHDARTKHGRAILYGDDLRLQGGHPRRRYTTPILPDANDGSGHNHARAGPGDRCRCRWASGHRHSPSAWCGDLRVRPPPAAKEQVQSSGRPLRGIACRGRKTPRMRAATLGHRTRPSTSASASCWGGSWRKATSSSQPRWSRERSRPCW